MANEHICHLKETPQICKETIHLKLTFADKLGKSPTW